MERPVAKPVVNKETGEILAEANLEITDDLLSQFRKAKIKQFKVIFFDGLAVGPYLRNTLLIDKVSNEEEALLDIYKRMRPSEPPVLEAAQSFLHKLFFDPETYNLSEVGRLKINYKFGFSFDEVSLETKVLTKQDIVHIVKTLIDLKNGRGRIDDIDHLGNRRIRSVGELLENQYRIGLSTDGACYS